MKHYLSHGMGVNSTALMILLEKEGIEFESVFVDHGGDYPETYKYLEYLRDKGYEITVITPNEADCQTIEEYCLKYKIVPGRWRRWCTDKFKIRPLLNYYEKPCINFVGICFDEINHRTRIKKYYQEKHKQNRTIAEYPLVEKRISRMGCIRIIKKTNLKVPRRSGCWLCPFMRRDEVRKLYVEYPDLYERRKKIEENCSRNFYFDSKNSPMSSIAPENMPKLEEFMEVIDA